jgi:hypothetical protein
VFRLLGNPCQATAGPLQGSLGTCGMSVAHDTNCSFECNKYYGINGDVHQSCNAGVLYGTQSCSGLGPSTPTYYHTVSYYLLTSRRLD